jgi:sec-independent protein translocase protein TatB
VGFEVFGVGVPEMVLIAVVALIFIGPERLPEAARTVGGWVREIRGLTSEAAGIWQETLQVGDSIRDSVRVDPRAGANRPAAPAPPAALPSPAAGYPVSPTAMPVTYTPPAPPTEAPEAGPPPTLDYPAPFAAAAPAPPKPEALSYPAPFADDRPDAGVVAG